MSSPSRFPEDPSCVSPGATPPAHTLFRVALVGAGSPFASLVRLLCHDNTMTTQPWITVAGMAHVPYPLPTLSDGTPCLHAVPVFPTLPALFHALPEVNMVIDLSDTGEHLDALRTTAPPQCSILCGSAASVLWDMLFGDRLCHSCRRELRRTQDLFSALADHMDEDIMLLDANGTILEVNQAFINSRGGTWHDYVGRHCDDMEGGNVCCPPEEGGCTFRETLRTGRKAERVHSLVTEDGKVRFFRIYTYPVPDPDGKIHRIIEIRRDITLRTQKEQHEQQAERMAAIGELSTYIAHEIRNPLFAIGGFANSLLRSTTLDEDSRAKVDIILKESRRLDAILKTALNFTRPADAATGEVDINLATAETLQLMYAGCEEYGLRLSVKLAPGIAMGRGEAGMFKQCVINLVKNGMEAMQPGGMLSVRTGMTRSHVYVTVQDTGTGIPDAVRDKIFSPFFSTKDKGAGLGLAMTRKIVEEMGGYVELHSREGAGTSASLFLLPVLAVEGDETQGFKPGSYRITQELHNPDLAPRETPDPFGTSGEAAAPDGVGNTGA